MANSLRKQLKILMEPLYDPSHRVSNDILMGANVAGFPVLLAMKLCYSLNYGPWDGAKWWRAAQESLRDALANFSPELQPLWASLLQHVAQSSGAMMLGPPRCGAAWRRVAL